VRRPLLDVGDAFKGCLETIDRTTRDLHAGERLTQVVCTGAVAVAGEKVCGQIGRLPAIELAAHQFINPNCFALPSRVGQNGPTILPPIYGPAFFNWDMGLFKNFVFKESKKVQIRFNGYNYLNHPLWSFNGSNLTLGFDSNTAKVNTPLFGTVTQKQGHRVIQTAIKFFF